MEAGIKVVKNMRLRMLYSLWLVHSSSCSVFQRNLFTPCKVACEPRKCGYFCGELAMVPPSPPPKKKTHDKPFRNYMLYKRLFSTAEKEWGHLASGVDFRLRISPRIRSQNRNCSKASVRDLCRPELSENIGKFG